jgi:hypothetical protein
VRRLSLGCAALALVFVAPARARAAAGTAFGETSRVASLAGAVSARPGDAGSMLANPAGLTDVTEPVVLLGAHVDYLSSWFAREGEPRQDLDRTFGGFSFAAATPLPGPPWLRRFHLGVALDLPAQDALRVSVAERLDQPTLPIYDGRPDRTSVLGAVGVRLLDRLQLGAGVSLTPSLTTPTSVTFVAGRDPSVQRDVVVRIDSDLELGVAPFVGLRAEPTDALGLAVAYRAANVSRATGSQRTVAGGILADDPIDYVAFWDPAELTAGAAVGPLGNLSLSADLTWHRWSDFQSGFDTAVDPPFRDTVSVRAGVEWQAKKWLVLRGGAAFEPSPVPEQYGVSNYLGEDAMVLALGGGVDLRALTGAPLRLDGHVRARLGATESASKRAGSLPDADPNTPGQQIDNLGYPGFSSSASLYQAGITLTLFVGHK